MGNEVQRGFDVSEAALAGGIIAVCYKYVALATIAHSTRDLRVLLTVNDGE